MSLNFRRNLKKNPKKGPVFEYYARTLTNLNYPTEPRGSKDEIEYCQDFQKDLRTLHGMSFVEPIAKGKTIDDSAVHAYWPQCSKLEPDYVAFPAGVPLYYWKGSVRLYKVDYQNGMAADQEIKFNYAPGSEPLLLFSERLCANEATRLMPQCIGSLYDRVDTDQCMLDHNVVGGDDIYIDQNKYNLNAVITYKGLIWLIGVADGLGQYQKYLTVTANGPVKPVHMCLFSVDLQNTSK